MSVIHLKHLICRYKKQVAAKISKRCVLSISLLPQLKVLEIKLKCLSLTIQKHRLRTYIDVVGVDEIRLSSFIHLKYDTRFVVLTRKPTIKTCSKLQT